MFYHFPNVDHHLTTTVQLHRKMSEKPIVTTNNGLFLVSSATVQNQHNLRSNASLYRPVVVLRPGRPEVRILPVAPKKGRCIAVQRPFLFCHGSVIVNPSFDYRFCCKLLSAFRLPQCPSL